MTVLVIDDDASAREYSRSLLEGSGFSVTEAHDGTSALEKVAKTMPECIVMDLVMPGLSGFETLRSMRTSHATLPPVIVLTSMDGAGTRTYATKVNKADAFITKSELGDPANGLIAQVRRLTRA
jgi:CheY-like chemotaxis protein